MNKTAFTRNYALVVMDRDGTVLYSVDERTLRQRVVYALRAVMAVFTGKTLI